MGHDSITLHLHHGRKFMKGRKLKHDGGSYRSIKLVDTDRLSYFEAKGIAREFTKQSHLKNPTAVQHVECDWEHPRPESPLPWHDLVGGDLASSNDNSDYHPDGENDDDDSDNNGVGKEVVTVGRGFKLQNEYKDSEAETKTPGESDEEDNMFLRRKKRTPRVDDNIDVSRN
ncbi:hypothetical protein Cgig2_009940 [Carnegiea gigantea]|uniref:PB1-like domain-containing protein n=1 Tax=Carnegiea gigantea TaxID=171969 RepID=A0A9Q1K044_9CARY|nr:hypothetical protein Cgig2_009940 [Carnegiea gigantea]